MKSFAPIFSLACFTGAMAAAVSEDPIITTTPIASASGTSIASAPLSSVATIIPPPIIPPPVSTGGFVVTGIYTTCLTVTFAAPSPTGACNSTESGAPSGTVSASSAPGVTSFTGTVFSEPIPTGSLSASETVIASSPVVSGITSIVLNFMQPLPNEAVFTTCLAFLATPTDTPTITPTNPVTATNVASGSASPIVSASAPA
ncbi:hypothetical protein K438DRAFT_1783601 [Mycena galopus ATCC 62051]|nr:hypothetical protein K438DRAFT_1783601 [Mycena galopus ATCC 62051]